MSADLEIIKRDIIKAENNLLDDAARLKQYLLNLEKSLLDQNINPLTDRQYLKALELDIELAKHLVKLKREVIQMKENNNRFEVKPDAYRKFQEE